MDIRQSKGYIKNGASLMAQQVKNPPAMKEACVQDGTISWRKRNIPVFLPEKALRAEVPKRPLCTGAPKVRHNWKKVLSAVCT